VELITISQSVTVTALGVVGQAATGAQGTLALYENAGGVPGSLVAQTGTTTVIAAGPNEIATTAQVPITAGTYWIGAEYNATAAICIDGSKTNTLQLTTITTYGTVPLVFGGPTTITGAEDVNYYVFGIVP